MLCLRSNDCFSPQHSVELVFLHVLIEDNRLHAVAEDTVASEEVYNQVVDHRQALSACFELFINLVEDQTNFFESRVGVQVVNIVYVFYLILGKTLPQCIAVFLCFWDIAICLRNATVLVNFAHIVELRCGKEDSNAAIRHEIILPHLVNHRVWNHLYEFQTGDLN